MVSYIADIRFMIHAMVCKLSDGHVHMCVIEATDIDNTEHVVLLAACTMLLISDTKWWNMASMVRFCLAGDIAYVEAGMIAMMYLSLVPLQQSGCQFRIIVLALWCLISVLCNIKCCNAVQLTHTCCQCAVFAS